MNLQSFKSAVTRNSELVCCFSIIQLHRQNDLNKVKKCLEMSIYCVQKILKLHVRTWNVQQYCDIKSQYSLVVRGKLVLKLFTKVKDVSQESPQSHCSSEQRKVSGLLPICAVSKRLTSFFSCGYAKRRNDYCCGSELYKFVTHSDVNKSIIQRDTN